MSKNNKKKNQAWYSDSKSSVFKIKTIKSENNSYLTILLIFFYNLIKKDNKRNKKNK